MSLFFLESFDLVNTTAGLGQKGWFFGGFGGYGFTTGRTDQSFFVNNNTTYFYQTFPGATHATWTIGFAWQYGGTATGGNICGFLGDTNATLHMTLAVTSGGFVQVLRGSGTVLAQSTVAIPPNTWVYLEMSVTLSSSAGVVQVNQNNVPVISLTGANTKNGGTATVFDSVRLGDLSGGSNPGNYIFDDLYLTNGAGSANTGLLGDIAVKVLRPTGNGDLSQFTNSGSTSVNNFSFVNSTRAQNTTFVQDGTVGQEDTYAMTALPATIAHVYGIQTCYYALKSDTGARSLVPVIRESGTDHLGTSVALGTSVVYYQQVWETDPGTGAAWTYAGLSAAQVGQQVA